MSKKIDLVEVMLLGSSIKNLNKSGAGAREEHYYKVLDAKISLKLFQYHPSSNIDINNGPKPLRNKFFNSIFGPIIYRNYYKINKGIGIVRSKQLWGSWAGFLIGFLTNRKHVIRCGYIWSRSFNMERKTSTFLSKVVEIIERFIFSLADSYIFCSDDIKNFYLPYTKKKQYIVLPNYINTSLFKNNNTKRTKHFLYVGRLISLKGVEEAIDFVHSYKNIGSTTFIGQGPLFEKANKSDIEIIDSIENTNLPDYMNDHKFFINFSKTEGSPKALIEAISCGMYPILSDIPIHNMLTEELGYGLIHGRDLITKDVLNNSKIIEENLLRFQKDYSMDSYLEKEIDFLCKL